jgi:hypothetical protein
VMINVDTRLLSEVNESELWLLIHIAKRLNKNRICWPSNRMLCRETGWSLKTLQKVKQQLIDKKLMVVVVRKHPEGGQGANAYQIKTELISVFVNLKDIEVEIADTPEQNLPTGGHSKNSQTPEQNLGNIEVLSNEVLSSDVAGATGDLFNAKASKKKKAAEVDPSYKQCVDIWLKKIHPGWVFGGVQGKALKSLLGKIKASCRAKGMEGTVSQVIEFFEIMCAHLPTWFKDKDLPVIDSKYNEIITQIENGKTGHTKGSSSWIDDLYNKAAQ